MHEMNNLVREESGQTMAEYSVVLTVITIAVVASLAVLSSSINNVISTVITRI